MNHPFGNSEGEPPQWDALATLGESEMRVGLSGKVGRTPWSDFLDRFGNGSIHEAELFHCNSRISTASQVNSALSTDRIEEIRRWLQREAYVPREGSMNQPKSEREGFTMVNLDSRLRAVITDDEVDSFLAVELYLCLEGMVYRARNGRLWLERKLSPDDTKRMADYLHLEQPCRHSEVRSLILYAGFPWRYMAFQGPRGYRRMLIELGKKISRVELLLQAAGLTVTTSLDFYDVTIESFLGFDGVETTLLATTATQCTDNSFDAES